MPAQRRQFALGTLLKLVTICAVLLAAVRWLNWFVGAMVIGSFLGTIGGFRQVRSDSVASLLIPVTRGSLVTGLTVLAWLVLMASISSLFGINVQGVEWTYELDMALATFFIAVASGIPISIIFALLGFFATATYQLLQPTASEEQLSETTEEAKPTEDSVCDSQEQEAQRFGHSLDRLQADASAQRMASFRNWTE